MTGLESERAALGYLAAHPEAWDQCPLRDVEITGADARKVFESASIARRTFTVPDFRTLIDSLLHNEHRSAAQWLSNAMVTYGDHDPAPAYAAIRERTRRSRLASACREVAAGCADSEAITETLLEAARAAIRDAENDGPDRTDTDAGDAAIAEVRRLEAGDDPAGVGIGIPGYDVGLGGATIGELVVVAARPSMGKTALLVQGADVLSASGVQCFFVSAEMTRQQLAWRFLSRLTQIPVQAMRRRALSREQQVRMAKAAVVIKRRNRIRLIDRVTALSQIASEIHRWAAETQGPRAIFIDYLQRLPIPQKKGQSRTDAIGEATWLFKDLARHGPVFLASQLSREVEKETRKPRLSDLRDSGCIEQDADQVLFPWRPDISENPTQAELIIAKNRNGEVGQSFALKFDPPTASFTQEGSFAPDSRNYD